MADLAVRLQAKSEADVKDPGFAIGKLAAMTQESHHPTAGLNAINQMHFAQFKV